MVNGSYTDDISRWFLGGNVVCLACDYCCWVRIAILLNSLLTKLSLANIVLNQVNQDQPAEI